MSDKQFTVTTVETVHRSYTVTAVDEKAAKSRLHLHWKDPEVLREGLIQRTDSEEIQHRQVKAVVEPRAAKTAPTAD